MRRREGPWAPLFYSAALILFASAAGAQTVERTELAACAALPTDAERLACFQALAADPLSRPAEAPEPAPPPQPNIPASAAPAAAPGTATVTSAAPASGPAAEPAPVVSPGNAEDDFGREDIDPAAAAGTDELRAIVTEAVRKRNKGVTFFLDNGQVWQQVDDRYFPYPKDEPFEIVIAEGMMGDYRLRIGDGRMIRVQRTQ